MGLGPALLDNAMARDPFDFGGSQLLINADIEPDADGVASATRPRTNAPPSRDRALSLPWRPHGLSDRPRAAALKRCKQTAKKKDWTKKKLRRCKQKATLLPVLR